MKRIALSTFAVLVACGAPPAPAPPEPPVPVRTPPPEIQTRAEGLEMTFDPVVRAQDAREYAFQCRPDDPSDEPGAARFTCPVDLKGLRIDVREGPAGTSLMIFTGDPVQADALREWFEAQRHRNE